MPPLWRGIATGAIVTTADMGILNIAAAVLVPEESLFCAPRFLAIGIVVYARDLEEASVPAPLAYS